MITQKQLKDKLLTWDKVNSNKEYMDLISSDTESILDEINYIEMSINDLTEFHLIYILHNINDSII